MDFPTDDVTLAAIEHAMDGSLTFDKPDSVDEDDDGPWLVGSDYGLDQLLDFYSDAVGPDPNGYEENGWTVDTRIHFTYHDIIKALIQEVRRMRDEE